MALLDELGAPGHLKRHGELVTDVAVQLVDGLTSLGLELDRAFVQCGALLHDSGKIQVPAELHSPGRLHEAAGEEMLLAIGVAPKLARVCRTHAAWDDPSCELEEQVIALADKLWKGRRVDELELLVIDRVAGRLGQGRFDIFQDLDGLFEGLAADGDRRLTASLGGGSESVP